MAHKSLGYNLSKGEDTIYQWHHVSGEAITRIFERKGCRQIITLNEFGSPQKIWCEYRYSIRGGRVKRKASDYRTSEKYRYLITKGIRISRLLYHNQMLQSNTSRLNGLRWTTNQKLICREPAVSGRTSEPEDNIWVTTDDSVHSHKGRINKIKGKSQRILMNAARHMDLTIMQAGEKGQEQ